MPFPKPDIPIVDVVIPTWKRTALTWEALQSVLNQTNVTCHVYIVEDGEYSFSNWLSRSKTGQEGPVKLPLPANVHLIQSKSNQGPSIARNLAAARGNAEYLAFLDSDDLWAPDKLFKQIDFLQKNPHIRWVHTDEAWLRNGSPVKQKKIHRKSGGFLIERLLERCLISPSAVLFKRDFFETDGWFASAFRVAEDYELWLRLNFRYEVGYVDEPLTIKRAGGWEQLSSTPQMDRQRVLALHRFYRMFGKSKNKEFIREFHHIEESWRNSALKKIHFLIKGAQKYQNELHLRQYQSWEYLFKMLRTSA